LQFLFLDIPCDEPIARNVHNQSWCISSVKGIRQEPDCGACARPTPILAISGRWADEFSAAPANGNFNATARLLAEHGSSIGPSITDALSASAVAVLLSPQSARIIISRPFGVKGAFL
jgi:hypothetical protein